MRHINNQAVSSGDPQAIEKLTLKLEKCKEVQKYMKDVNAYFRKHGTCVGYPGMDDTVSIALTKQVMNGFSWEFKPFHGSTLANNSAEIRRLKKRIEIIYRNREIGFNGWDFQGGKAIANTKLNRLQLFFIEEPNGTQRSQLKSNGFKWAPSQGAWQRHLNDNAIYAAGRIDFVKPLDGRSVRDHQPKAPTKDTRER